MDYIFQHIYTFVVFIILGFHSDATNSIIESKLTLFDKILTGHVITLIVLWICFFAWLFSAPRVLMIQSLENHKIELVELQKLETKNQEDLWKSNSCLVYDYSCSRYQKSGNIEYKCQVKTNEVKNIIGNQILTAYKTC